METRWRQLGEREEEEDRECPLSVVTLVCMYRVYSWFVYMLFFYVVLPGPTIRRHRRHRTISHIPDVWYTI